MYLSVNELKANGDPNLLYPNPAIDKLHFSHSEKFDKITVNNALGQKVKEIFHAVIEYEIDVSDLLPGIYYVNTENNEGQRVYKILKK